jgi:hypothetical protein
MERDGYSVEDALSLSTTATITKHAARHVGVQRSSMKYNVCFRQKKIEMVF